MEVYKQTLLNIYDHILDSTTDIHKSDIFIIEQNTVKEMTSYPEVINYIKNLALDISNGIISNYIIREIIECIEHIYTTPDELYELACIYYFLKRSYIINIVHNLNVLDKPEVEKYLDLFETCEQKVQVFSFNPI